MNDELLPRRAFVLCSESGRTRIPYPAASISAYIAGCVAAEINRFQG